MKIGEVAKAGGCDVQTVRHYEKVGLLPASPRAPNGYRQYGAREVERVCFIRRCRELGMSLKEIRSLLDYRDKPARSCGEVNEILDRHIAGIAIKIESLRGLHALLSNLRRRCARGRRAQRCGILGALSGKPDIK